MKVESLKRVLKNALHRLEKYDPEQEVKMVSNTYFLGDCYYFLGVSGYDGGYIDLEKIKVEVDDEEDDYDEEE